MRMDYVNLLGESGRKHHADAPRLLKRDASKALGFDPTVVSKPPRFKDLTYDQGKMRNWLRGKE